MQNEFNLFVSGRFKNHVACITIKATSVTPSDYIIIS